MPNSSEDLADRVLRDLEWEMSNFMPAKGESSVQCERRRLRALIVEALNETRDETRASFAGGHGSKILERVSLALDRPNPSIDSPEAHVSALATELSNIRVLVMEHIKSPE